MMRVLHLADLHLRLAGARAAECRRILDHVAEHASDVRPDAIIIAGDVFDRRSTPEERLYLAGFLRTLVDASAGSVHVIPGNHDCPEDVELFGRLIGVRVWTEPAVIEHRGLALAFLPWPRLGHLAASLGSEASIADRRAAARAALLDLLRGLRADPGLRPGAPSLLVAHLSVFGASMDAGQPVTGRNEIALSADDLLSCGAAGVALGHVHLRQQMQSCNGRPVWYAGAPYRCSFGEATGGKGELLWTWESGDWRVEPWDVPARRMLLLETTWERGMVMGLGGCEPADAEIRLRIEFPGEEREAVRREAAAVKAHLEMCGAHSVTIEERPLVVQRTRCVEIAAARTTAEKLVEWSKAAGLEVPEGAAGKLAALEAEVQP